METNLLQLMSFKYLNSLITLRDQIFVKIEWLSAVNKYSQCYLIFNGQIQNTCQNSNHKVMNAKVRVKAFAQLLLLKLFHLTHHLILEKDEDIKLYKFKIKCQLEQIIELRRKKEFSYRKQNIFLFQIMKKCQMHQISLSKTLCLHINSFTSTFGLNNILCQFANIQA